MYSGYITRAGRAPHFTVSEAQREAVMLEGQGVLDYLFYAAVSQVTENH